MKIKVRSDYDTFIIAERGMVNPSDEFVNAVRGYCGKVMKQDMEEYPRENFL